MTKLQTFPKRSGNFRQLAENLQRSTLEKIAHFAIDRSPVDTAAYVDSFGFNNPQAYNSKDRPRTRPGPTVDPVAAKERNKARLSSEVNSIGLEGPVVFANNSPHNMIVEEGTPTQSGNFVFAQTRREFTSLARRALSETRES